MTHSWLISRYQLRNATQVGSTSQKNRLKFHHQILLKSFSFTRYHRSRKACQCYETKTPWRV